MLDSLAMAQARQHFGLLFLQLWRYDRHDRLSDHLLRRVPKNSHCARIPGRDRAVQCFADNGVVRAFDDGSEPATREVSPSLLSDVTEDEHHAEELARGQSNGRGAVINRNFPTITPEQDCMVRQSRDGPCLEYFRHGIVGGSTCPFIDDREYLDEWPASGLTHRPSRQMLRDGVEERRATVEVGHDDGIANARQRDFQDLALPAQRILDFTPCF